MERKSLSIFMKEWFLFSVLVLPFLLIGLYFNSSDLSKLLTEFIRFVLAQPNAITSVTLVLADASILLLIGIFGILFSGVSDDIIGLAIGSPKRKKVLDDIHKYSFFKTLLIFVFTAASEELIFRGFFLGVLPRWTGIQFYILLLISNAVFAYLHIFNYKGTGRAVKFIPLFLTSFVFAYVFLKFGLIACFLVHFFHNFIATIFYRLYLFYFGKHPSSI
ncbi:MAG: hypothetical protein UV01_C0012G0031 [Parcubacteria group bacterium GW2011_GWA2_42_14]|nr:MAG: hypothetical protein UV01_C0012G0031 [Parcubacteria group bacterium GW2011_GWA2_42_14]